MRGQRRRGVEEKRRGRGREEKRREGRERGRRGRERRGKGREERRWRERKGKNRRKREEGKREKQEGERERRLYVSQWSSVLTGFCPKPQTFPPAPGQLPGGSRPQNAHTGHKNTLGQENQFP